MHEKQEHKTIPLEAEQVEHLTKRFTSLNKYASDSLFPPEDKQIETLITDTDGWSRFRRTMFYIIFPAQWLLSVYPKWVHNSRAGESDSDESEGISPDALRFLGAFTAWIFAILGWWILADISLHWGLRHPLPDLRVQVMQTMVGAVISVFLSILAVVMLPLAYWRWVVLFWVQGYTKIHRIWIVLIFVLLLIFLPYLMLTQQQPAFQLAALWPPDGATLWKLVLAYIIGVIPLSTLFSKLLFDGLAILKWFLDRLAVILVKSYKPFSKDMIHKLITEPIPMENGEENWCLTSLGKRELALLHNWMKENRKNLHQRMLLLITFTGVMILCVVVLGYNEAIAKILVKLFESPFQINIVTLFVYFWLSMLVLFAAITLLMILLLSNLFASFIAQNVVIEACLVAQYIREQRNSIPDAQP